MCASCWLVAAGGHFIIAPGRRRASVVLPLRPPGPRRLHGGCCDRPPNRSAGGSDSPRQWSEKSAIACHICNSFRLAFRCGAVIAPRKNQGVWPFLSVNHRLPSASAAARFFPLNVEKIGHRKFVLASGRFSAIFSSRARFPDVREGKSGRSERGSECSGGLRHGGRRQGYATSRHR